MKHINRRVEDFAPRRSRQKVGDFLDVRDKPKAERGSQTGADDAEGAFLALVDAADAAGAA